MGHRGTSRGHRSRTLEKSLQQHPGDETTTIESSELLLAGGVGETVSEGVVHGSTSQSAPHGSTTPRPSRTQRDEPFTIRGTVFSSGILQLMVSFCDCVSFRDATLVCRNWRDNLRSAMIQLLFPRGKEPYHYVQEEDVRSLALFLHPPLPYTQAVHQLGIDRRFFDLEWVGSAGVPSHKQEPNHVHSADGGKKSEKAPARRHAPTTHVTLATWWAACSSHNLNPYSLQNEHEEPPVRITSPRSVLVLLKSGVHPVLNLIPFDRKTFVKEQQRQGRSVHAGEILYANDTATKRSLYEKLCISYCNVCSSNSREGVLRKLREMWKEKVLVPRHTQHSHSAASTHTAAGMDCPSATGQPCAAEPQQGDDPKETGQEVSASVTPSNIQHTIEEQTARRLQVLQQRLEIRQRMEEKAREQERVREQQFIQRQRKMELLQRKIQEQHAEQIGKLRKAKEARKRRLNDALQHVREKERERIETLERSIHEHEERSQARREEENQQRIAERMQRISKQDIRHKSVSCEFNRKAYQKLLLIERGRERDDYLDILHENQRKILEGIKRNFSGTPTTAAFPISAGGAPSNASAELSDGIPPQDGPERQKSASFQRKKTKKKTNKSRVRADKNSATCSSPIEKLEDGAPDSSLDHVGKVPTENEIQQVPITTEQPPISE